MAQHEVRVTDWGGALPVKNRGVAFAVAIDEKHFGDVRARKTGILVCPGRTQEAQGVMITWRQLFSLADELREGRIRLPDAPLTRSSGSNPNPG